MSLASRLASLFSFGADTQQRGGQNPITVDDHGSSRREDVLDRVQNSAFESRTMASEEVEEEGRPPYLHVCADHMSQQYLRMLTTMQCMIAGGIGGSTGDLLMHSLDTVKTRQQGDVRRPAKYTTMLPSYSTIWRQEGLRRGLYGGWIPAMAGSFPGTIIFFGTYEFCKRHMIDFGITPQLAYLTGGT